MFTVEKYKLLLLRLLKNNMHQTNTCFCDEALQAIYIQIKCMEKYLKKFGIASISMFCCACFLGTLQFYNSFAIKVLLYEKIQRFINKFESHLQHFIYLFFIVLFFPSYTSNSKSNFFDSQICNITMMLILPLLQS